MVRNSVQPWTQPSPAHLRTDSSVPLSDTPTGTWRRRSPGAPVTRQKWDLLWWTRKVKKWAIKLPIFTEMGSFIWNQDADGVLQCHDWGQTHVPLRRKPITLQHQLSCEGNKWKRWIQPSPLITQFRPVPRGTDCIDHPSHFLCLSNHERPGTTEV